MTTKSRLGMTVLSLCLGVATASASDSVSVKSSRHLRVAIIDASKQGVAKTSVHEAFAASLAASMQRQGAPLAVKLTEQTDAGKVATDLVSGAYDAALVFENALPNALTVRGFSTARGVSQIGVPVRVFHLVVRNDDANLVAMLNSAFSETVKAARFQEALSRSAAIRVVASR